MPKHCKPSHPRSASSPPDREAVIDSLAAAMAAIEAAAPSRVVRWTAEADAILRAATVRRLSLRATAGILSDYFGRPLSRDAITRRVEALGI